MTRPAPTKPGPYTFNCKECGREETSTLIQEDIDDGCRDGTLICFECLEGRVDYSTLYKLLGRKPH